MDKIIICNNHDCKYWKFENDFGFKRSIELDKTNCSVHTNEDILHGDCAEFFNIVEQAFDIVSPWFFIMRSHRRRNKTVLKFFQDIKKAGITGNKAGEQLRKTLK